MFIHSTISTSFILLFQLISLFRFSAEQAGRASIMGAFLRPESASGNGGISGRRGSDPRRPSALEQQVHQWRHSKLIQKLFEKCLWSFWLTYERSWVWTHGHSKRKTKIKGIDWSTSAMKKYKHKRMKETDRQTDRQTKKQSNLRS